MPFTLSAIDDEVCMIAVTVDLSVDTVRQLRALFPQATPEDAIAAIVEMELADAEEMNRKDGS